MTAHDGAAYVNFLNRLITNQRSAKTRKGRKTAPTLDVDSVQDELKIETVEQNARKDDVAGSSPSSNRSTTH